MGAVCLPVEKTDIRTVYKKDGKCVCVKEASLAGWNIRGEGVNL